MGALGALLAALGAILEKHKKINQKSMPKMTDVGSQKGAKREPKSNPKPTKIEDKNRCEKRTDVRSSWSRLGAILGRFGSPLGVVFVGFSFVFKGKTKRPNSPRLASPRGPPLYFLMFSYDFPIFSYEKMFRSTTELWPDLMAGSLL